MKKTKYRKGLIQREWDRRVENRRRCAMSYYIGLTNIQNEKFRGNSYEKNCRLKIKSKLIDFIEIENQEVW
jgi:hypothetical protein